MRQLLCCRRIRCNLSGKRSNDLDPAQERAAVTQQRSRVGRLGGRLTTREVYREPKSGRSGLSTSGPTLPRSGTFAVELGNPNTYSRSGLNLLLPPCAPKLYHNRTGYLAP